MGTCLTPFQKIIQPFMPPKQLFARKLMQEDEGGYREFDGFKAFDRALELRRAKKYSEEIKLLDKIILSIPNHTNAYIARGEACTEMARQSKDDRILDHAKEDLRHALELLKDELEAPGTDNDKATTHCLMAHCYLNILTATNFGNDTRMEMIDYLKGAADHYAKAMELRPDDTNIARGYYGVCEIAFGFVGSIFVESVFGQIPRKEDVPKARPSGISPDKFKKMLDDFSVN